MAHRINPSVKLVPPGEAVVVLTDYVRSASLDSTAVELDATTAGSAGNVERIGGLFDGSVEIVFTQDFADSATYHTLKGLLGKTVERQIDPTAYNTQDEARVEVFIRNVPQIDGAINELSTIRASWPYSDMDGPEFTEVPPTPLFQTVMYRGVSGTKTGFNRDSGIGSDFGRLQLDDWDLGGGDGEFRIIGLAQDTASGGRLQIRTNQRQQLRGKWLEVGDRYVQMNFNAGDGSQTLPIPLADEANWASPYTWAAGAQLAVAVYDREPAGAAALTLRNPLAYVSAVFEADDAGTEVGYARGSYGTLAEADNLDFDVPDGSVRVQTLHWDSSGGGELELRMATAGQAEDMDGLWLRCQVGAVTVVSTAVTHSSGATLAITTQPTSAPWATGNDVTVEFFDRDPTT